MSLVIASYLVWDELEDLAADFNLHYTAQHGQYLGARLSPARVSVLLLSRFARWAVLIAIAVVLGVGVALGAFVAGFFVTLILSPLAGILRPLAWVSTPVAIPLAAAITILLVMSSS